MKRTISGLKQKTSTPTNREDDEFRRGQLMALSDVDALSLEKLPSKKTFDEEVKKIDVKLSFNQSDLKLVADYAKNHNLELNQCIEKIVQEYISQHSNRLNIEDFDQAA